MSSIVAYFLPDTSAALNFCMFSGLCGCVKSPVVKSSEHTSPLPVTSLWKIVPGIYCSSSPTALMSFMLFEASLGSQTLMDRYNK